MVASRAERPLPAASSGSPAALVLGWALLLAGLGVGLPACAAPAAAAPDEGQSEALGMASIETIRRLELAPVAAGLATEVPVDLVLAPRDPVALEVLGRRPEGTPGDDAVVEVSLAWTDYQGLHPTAYGGSTRGMLPFGEDGTARREQPLARRLLLQLPPPEASTLARRVSVWARLHPVDLIAGSVHSGGASLDFERVSALSFRSRPVGDLPAALADPAVDPGRLFLLAVGAGIEPASETERLQALVEALPTLAAAQREAAFGALQLLSGQTNGRSVSRWQSWWRHRKTAPASIDPPVEPPAFP